MIFLVFAAYNPLRLFKLPLGLGTVPTYYLFFYVGYMMSMGRIRLPKVNIAIPSILFLIAFCICMFLKNDYEAENIMEKVLRLGAKGFVDIIMSVTGVYVLYRLANISTIQKKIAGNRYLIKLSGYCYGVYIFQQFILIFLYFKTNFAENVNPYILPWLATLITIALSLLFTHILLRTRFGRFLIG